MVQALPWTAVFWFVGIASAIMIPVVRAIVPHGRDAAPKPLGEQLSYLKRPRVLLTFGLNLFWVAGYATLYSYITPFLQEATTLDDARRASLRHVRLVDASHERALRQGRWPLDPVQLEQ